MRIYARNQRGSTFKNKCIARIQKRRKKGRRSTEDVSEQFAKLIVHGEKSVAVRGYENLIKVRAHVKRRYF